MTEIEREREEILAATREKMVTTHVTLPHSLLVKLKVAHGRMAEQEGCISFSQMIRIVLTNGLRTSLRRKGIKKKRPR